MGALRLKNLKAEIAKTELGCFLLDYLRDNGVTLHVAKDMGDCAGVYELATKTIKIGDGVSLAEAMHTFAHEARHAAQFSHSRLGGLTRTFNIVSNPHSSALHLLMAEIDADVFGVYFLHDHRVKTGSGHFDAMREPPVMGILERRYLYSAFDHAWGETGHSTHKKDMQDILRFVAATWVFFESDLRNFYTRRSLAEWRKGVVPKIKGMIKFGDAYEKQMVITAASVDPKVSVAPMSVRYARLFHEAGFPSYMARRHQDDYAEMLASKSTRERAVVRAVARYRKLAAL